MAERLLRIGPATVLPARIHHESIRLHTKECLQFVDLTEDILAIVESSGIRDGLVNVQTRHTTTAVVINENEPLLMEDLRQTLEQAAPAHASYQHDRLDIRTVNMMPGELPNGHSHCKALFLRASETLNLIRGRVQLGQWQRVFLVELDRARERIVSVMVIGE